MEKLSVVIITINEEKNIGDCLESVKWVDEIVIVDSGSVDKTVKICEAKGCKVIESEWLGFGTTKQLAVNSANNDWILSLDADERSTDVLNTVIKKILSKDNKANGYRINRDSYYLGKLIRHSGWQNDRPLRLFNRKYGRFNDKIVHESVQIDGEIGYIRESLLHLSYPNMEIHIDKINRYSSLGAQKLFKKNCKVTLPGAVFRGVFKFIKMYIFKFGFLDGLNGLMLALISSFGVSLKYFKLWKFNQ